MNTILFHFANWFPDVSYVAIWYSDRSMQKGYSYCVKYFLGEGFSFNFHHDSQLLHQKIIVLNIIREKNVISHGIVSEQFYKFCSYNHFMFIAWML